MTAGGAEGAGRFPELRIRLPGWVEEAVPPPDTVYSTRRERMELAVELARRNVERETGGPFGAAVFDLRDGRLVAPGVNRVVPEGCSAAHAEIVALSLAQQAVGAYRLRREAGPGYELVTTAEPCAMCFGAVPWSGVESLVCGARSGDVRELGFDEGEKPRAWREALEERGVRVARDVAREACVEVLRRYREAGGTIYG